MLLQDRPRRSERGVWVHCISVGITSPRLLLYVACLSASHGRMLLTLLEPPQQSPNSGSSIGNEPPPELAPTIPARSGHASHRIPATP